MPALLDLMTRAEQQLNVCNSCRYCEGYCAVFPALERQPVLTNGNLQYLANLCHDCRACYQACMYAPPHDFGVNIPSLMSDVRAETYARYSVPRMADVLFRRSARVTAVAGAVGLLLTLLLVSLTGGRGRVFTTNPGPGEFYQVVPFLAMVVPGLVGGAYIVLILLAGFVMFWRDAGGSRQALLSPRVWAAAVGDALSLRFLEGGGPGCHYPDRERPSSSRRILHSLVAGGFGAAFVSTVLAAFYQDFLHQLPPYDLFSPPVIVGSVGGAAMIVGCSGLILLKTGSDVRLGTQQMRQMEFSFLVVLDLASVTGMLTLALRGTALMGVVLILHLATLVALYATAPYGKLVHAIYRFGALLRYRGETQSGVAAGGLED